MSKNRESQSANSPQSTVSQATWKDKTVFIWVKVLEEGYMLKEYFVKSVSLATHYFNSMQSVWSGYNVIKQDNKCYPPWS